MALTQVSTDGVKNDAITKVKIPANQIEASELADNAVDTNAIANNAVTAGKLASGVQTTINNNADNRVITGSGTANTLNGESNLTFNGSLLTVSGEARAHNFYLSANGSPPTADASIFRPANNSLGFATGSTERVRVTNNGLTFNGDTAAANALDDYEEGTFTPSFANVDNSAITINHYNYTKVGRLVHINAKFTVGSNNDGSGFGFQLPFSQAGSRENVISAISTRSGSNTAPFAFVINANQSYAYGKELDGFGNSQTAYATFAGDIILVTGTYEST